MKQLRTWKLLILLFLVTISIIFFISAYQDKKQKQISIELASYQTQNTNLPTNLTLRNIAGLVGMKMGTSVLIKPLRNDPKYREILSREFNLLTPENSLKFGSLSPERGKYNFDAADEIVDFAQKHKMQIHGQTLVWYRNLPDWLENAQWSREEAMDILKQHIYTVVNRYRDQISSWDVVNEAINQKGTLRGSFWLDKIGEDYIEMAFRWANEADPNARLFYNDHEGEELGIKSDGIYKLVKELRQKNVPIHGVGFQMHTSIKTRPDIKAVAANIKRLGELGLEVTITEMDVKIGDDKRPLSDKLTSQANIYQDIANVCLQAPNCNTLTTWGLSDNFSWIPIYFKHPDAPLLFDQSYKPKPAYFAVFRAFRNYYRNQTN
ncbi:endo-1,4-beta-xylanase [Anabaena sphaerica FACHB-251]|uniref:Beta-xylanase n=1 Tax=Anabaena sphaerica FACHB-251 TaxID=2692883 RepID=A0A926ZZZ2_9NOST|nr:endo-1,4-beta-xylanase [Anabaena sphaerica]MBD2293059.1 endo-1,4-beta-xylanase [Anabaena sphaerica FACHB-251]